MIRFVRACVCVCVCLYFSCDLVRVILIFSLFLFRTRLSCSNSIHDVKIMGRREANCVFLSLLLLYANPRPDVSLPSACIGGSMRFNLHGEKDRDL
jgi:hypothetical protein